MQEGRILNINSSIYTVESNDKLYKCTLRGLFRQKKITPFVGDNVVFDERTNQIVKVYDRKNSLLRPNIANVDIALIITALKPKLDLYLLDKLISSAIIENVKPVVCFTKVDLLSKDEYNEFSKILKYYNLIGIDSITNTDIKKFKQIVKNNVVVCSGQTGAGKSTFINLIDPNLRLETKPISEYLNRGVHTTRYVTLYKEDNFYIADTPGFSFIDISKYTNKQIRDSFLEFNIGCKYKDCNHINTEGCNVIDNDKILQSRYDNYKRLIGETNESSGKFFKK